MNFIRNLKPRRPRWSREPDWLLAGMLALLLICLLPGMAVAERKGPPDSCAGLMGGSYKLNGPMEAGGVTRLSDGKIVQTTDPDYVCYQWWLIRGGKPQVPSAP